MRIYILLIIGFALFACKENVFTPKPRTYPRVVYPEKKYKLFSSICFVLITEKFQ